MTIEQKREMLWNALDSFAHSESEKIVKQEELVDYMLKNIPEKVFRKDLILVSLLVLILLYRV